MFLQEGELKKLCTCIWFCECINNELDDSSSWMTHDCRMIVYHVFRLVILEG
jgi:cytochrome c-type biogenesis protein CcmH/NrfF